MTTAFARYLTDSSYSLDDALHDGMTDDEYVTATDPYADNT